MLFSTLILVFISALEFFFPESLLLIIKIKRKVQVKPNFFFLSFHHLEIWQVLLEKMEYTRVLLWTHPVFQVQDSSGYFLFHHH